MPEESFQKLSSATRNTICSTLVIDLLRSRPQISLVIAVRMPEQEASARGDRVCRGRSRESTAVALAAARELAARSKRPRRRYRAMTDDEESSSDDGEAVLGDDSRDEADSSAAGDE